MTEGTVQANGIEIAYESIGEGPPVVLIMGLGAPTANWPLGFYRAFAERGCRAIRFDNRDVGRSTYLDHLGAPQVKRNILRRAAGRSVRAPYRLEDMADDLAGLLDGLDIDRAHLIGVSMGGMIAQTFAIRYPARTWTLTSIMSCTGSRLDLLGRPHALATLLQPVPPQREAAIERTVEILSVIGSRTHPTPRDELRDVVEECVERGMHPPGLARHWGAILASGSRWRRLRHVTTPSLVLHGDEDPLIPLRGGRATAWSIPGARLRCVRGMGHDLPRPLWGEIVEAILGLVLAGNPPGAPDMGPR